MPIFDSNNTFKIITVASAGFNYRIQQQHQQVTWANHLQGTDKHTLRSISHFTQSLWQFSWKYIEPQFGDYITSRQWFESQPAVTFTFEDITAPSLLRSLVTVQWTHCKLSSSQPRLDLVTQKKRCTFDYLHQFLRCCVSMKKIASKWRKLNQCYSVWSAAMGPHTGGHFRH